MATKEAYRKKLEAQLKEWDARLELLGAKSRQATADARIAYENELESVRKKREVAHQTLADLAKRSETAWEDMKDEADKVWDEMRKAMEKVASRFK